MGPEEVVSVGSETTMFKAVDPAWIDSVALEMEALLVMKEAALGCHAVQAPAASRARAVALK